MAFAYPELHLVVAGRQVKGGGRTTEPVLNPATGARLADLPLATEADLDEALAAADVGFSVWRRVSAVDRAKVLKCTADLMRERREYLAFLVTSELGKPLAQARLEVEQAAGMFEWYAEEGKRSYGRIIPSRAEGTRQMSVREPVGPIAAFSPWNAPAITPSRKIGGALAAGCSVIVKPSEETPATALAIAGMLEEAGLPAGVLSMVFGHPAMISGKLLSSPVIRGITFTGSTAIGKLLASQAVQSMKRMTLELGGHAPVIVFDDVDAEKVGVAAATAKYRNAGQVCTSPTRFYVQAGIYERFARAFEETAKAITVGDGFDPATGMGPLANARRVEAMEEFVADARHRGIRLSAGGERCCNAGFFYRPTLLTDFSDDCMAANVEPFGPLAIARPFETFDEAILSANRLPFGLAAYAMTNDVRRAHAVAEAIEAGNVILNHWTVSLPETPFGGVKESGFGSEGGLEGLQAFQNTKFISTLALQGF
ncbi:NAD-dependent succinate-semialdehyde dehydrogenase [Xanthobacter autotrophicus DSM 597]|uniref:NAD-dependent succinate-semialdehyde dehydrogenase n=1 Tax=Xanthobacter TaxID=279 RepID=UPI000BDDED6F|nr:MAG: NAD-dependent succinate-semialdehyde dehydrogenase [Rhizobiales bacterium 12-68-15]OYX90564.1 MAG: NAD-dependent succinate-semialdehyde dehydrogenase [Azorhizobium sp. 32-67-21]